MLKKIFHRDQPKINVDKTNFNFETISKLYSDLFSSIGSMQNEIDSLNILLDALFSSANKWVIPIHGRSAGVTSQIVLRFSADLAEAPSEDYFSIEASGYASIISTVTSNDGDFTLHTITANCPTGFSGSITVNGADLIRSLGNHRGSLIPNSPFYYHEFLNPAIVHLNFNHIPGNLEKINFPSAQPGNLIVFGSGFLPSSLTFALLSGSNILLNNISALPANLTVFRLINTIAYFSNPALPADLVNLQLSGDQISGSLPSLLPEGLTSLTINSKSIALSADQLPYYLGTLHLSGDHIKIAGELPESLTFIYLDCPMVKIDDFTTLGNPDSPSSLFYLELLQWFHSPLSGEDLLSLFNVIILGFSTLPSSITIKQYTESPSFQEILDATAQSDGTTAQMIKNALITLLATSGLSMININNFTFSNANINP